MEQLVLISVIVPVYKVEKYLDRCIESIVNQTHNNLEIILVDDGSPDLCPKMCDEWAEKDSRIVVIHKENGGLSDARNAGMEIMTGEYVSFVDSDDWIDYTFYESMMSCMQNTNSDVVECGIQYVSEKEDFLNARICGTDKLELNKIEALEKLILEQDVYQTVWNKLYKRSVIQNIGFAKGKYHEDEFWTYRVLNQINKMTLLRSPLYYYRQRTESIMGNRYSIKRLDGLEAKLERMKYFHNDDRLANVAYQQIWFDLLYHMQMVLFILEGNEQDKAKNYILENKPQFYLEKFSIDNKYKMWFWLFNKWPVLTAKLRNFLKIGM